VGGGQVFVVLRVQKNLNQPGFFFTGRTTTIVRVGCVVSSTRSRRFDQSLDRRRRRKRLFFEATKPGHGIERIGGIIRRSAG
jgi:hypothetical protein